MNKPPFKTYALITKQTHLGEHDEERDMTKLI